MIIGISGPSGSGKTTIARALRQFYASLPGTKSVRILHQDDFYKPEKDIPMKATRAGNVINWDCSEAVEMDALVQTLQAYRKHGKFPEDVERDLAERSKEDRNDVGDTGVSASTISEVEATQKAPKITDLLIVDGFMLFQSPKILESLDLAVLLRGSFKVLKDRREARSGYVTLEGFWKDPEGYFEDCVWPEYVSNHQQFFLDGDVEGHATQRKDIYISKAIDTDLDSSFLFVMDAIRGSLH
ncbi:Nicotinamide riboside kinase [Taphrina deformans PYCC 5710]|uniref:Nicotinamide riboside kinase n=1 Tax=Taphrina deformans (strain PYCC 5710 / ATCC 11124 / CBS 356.35 / IMI 108563 / JCM 9778 / NBRC 8474) TaxID=1097556 RepID=R4XDH3_TAPDE|nr:Nicotinamide riboside kinase [Taphrina deformans PYCC 5710]|eukprot:CCG81399.1 Nicotinamide riboside kinase [Taphrina deformans PYCC 5710]